MQRKCLLVLLALSVLTSSATWSQVKPTSPLNADPSPNPSKMTHEEEVVRTTYARLAFATQVDEVHTMFGDVLQQGQKQIDRAIFQRRLQSETLQFKLSNFKVGPISEIAKVKYSDLATKPAAADAGSLFVYTTDFHYSNDGNATNSLTARAKWMISPDINEDWDQSFAALYAQTELAGVHERYAAFSVHVTFQGRSRDYHAFFLFGMDKIKGTEAVFVGDMIIDIHGSALTRMTSEDVYPETLIEGGLGKDPVIREWLNGGQVSGAAMRSGKSNCDPVSLRCGVHVDDLKKLDITSL